jgi:oligopeptidase A
MLTTVDEGRAAGTKNIEWDAIEVASQFMENWLYHRETLLGMARHWETGAPLPEAIYEHLCAARAHMAGSSTLRQVRFALTDLELHHGFDPAGPESPFELARRVDARAAPLPSIPEDRWLCAFTHVFAGSYAAGYYSYKWAEVLSADAYAAFEEAGLDDPAAVSATGRRFRDSFLALGGSRAPMEVFRAFRGREPRPDALLRHSGLAGGE